VPPKYIYRDATTYLRPVRQRWRAGGVNVADPAAAALTTSEMAYRWGCHAKPRSTDGLGRVALGSGDLDCRAVGML
jgi:hypothetical protein